ncbi:MAG TPA: Na/Pi symporter, partial [Longimicrobiales bacterium]|nr:Na/Pi symporter [Longimicrobiales bacterium]
MTASILGGVGIFLLGMVILTDALKALAGDALRMILSRFVSGPWSAMLSGATATLLVQSSTATTLTTIGFVSAGLITFPQSIGVIFGANLGTTSTGWMVSMLGLHFSIAVAAMPAVAIGAVLRLLGRDSIAAAGFALAGFGLIFVGIDILQVGMAGLADRFDLSGLTGDTLGA